MNKILPVAVALFAGLIMTRIFKKLHLHFPDVTAFLIAGVCVGPFVLGALKIPGLGFASLEEVEATSAISEAALGFIAFDIGNEFRMSSLKQTGKTAFVIGVVQAAFATLVVDTVLVILYFVLGPDVLPLPVAITLGAIASATAPAATLMVVRQYKAKGPVTSLLLPIVALDDAVGLVIFAVSHGIAKAMSGGTLNAMSVAVNPIIEIVLSLGLGAIMGMLLTWLEKLFFSNSNRLSMTIAFVMMSIAISSIEYETACGIVISFSPLLMCMMLGTVFCNMSEFSADIMERSEKWTVPLYATFFVLSGAELDLSVLARPAVVLIGITYIIARSFGKYLGARGSAGIMKCSDTIKKYLGITLLPQAGVALGMVANSQDLGAADSAMIRNIVLFGVLIYELVGPMLTKLSLQKAGEIKPANPEHLTRERFRK